jgi:hypothetical protein
MTRPPQKVIDAIESPVTQVTRRAEIYESDGETLWDDAGTESRLLDGNVTVDGNRDERRQLDITLDNRDGALVHEPDSFWYDKVIKTFRGVNFTPPATPPRILVIEDQSGSQRIKPKLRNLGFYDVTFKTTATSLNDLMGYDIIVSDQRFGATGKTSLLGAAFDAGLCVMTIGNDSNAGNVPRIIGNSMSVPTITAYGMVPMTGDNPLQGGWTSENQGADSGQAITVLAAGVQGVATWTYSSTLTYTAAILEDPISRAKWFHFQPVDWNSQGLILMQNALNWMWDYKTDVEWEIQTGEFCIDRIDEANFPNRLKVTGRDYAKRMMLSKFERATMFHAGTDIEDLIQDIAANAGIFKLRLPKLNLVLPDDATFPSGTTRWKACQDIAESVGLEIFFDAFGYLVLRLFLDPTLGPLAMNFLTGESGNLASYQKSSNDSMIANHVTVTGDEALLVWAESLNTEPSSPTRIAKIGDRLKEIKNPLIKTNFAAQQLADSWLKIAALEEYNLDFSSFVYPWLEASEIISFTDPAKDPGDFPTRFLLSNFTIPMGLGAMPANGRRITLVGQEYSA